MSTCTQTPPATTKQPFLYDAYLTPEGVIHDVSDDGHQDAARRLTGHEQDTLYKLGWVKVSGGCWYGHAWCDSFEVSQKQFDYIYEWHQNCGRLFKPERFTVK